MGRAGPLNAPCAGISLAAGIVRGNGDSRRKGRAVARQEGDDLPEAAEARMAEIRGSGTWGSSLSADEFAAIKSTGFEPVGQVLGAAVYNIGYTGGYACPGAWVGQVWLWRQPCMQRYTG